MSKKKARKDGWIHIDQTLPPDDTDILVCFVHRYNNAPPETEIRVAYIEHGHCYSGGHEVTWPTYWRPLPKPPKITDTRPRRVIEIYKLLENTDNLTVREVRDLKDELKKIQCY